jgi:dienelactone hydrolase
MANRLDVLSDFTVEPYRAEGKTRDVYYLGSGPAVLVLSEMPGITPLVAAFAREVASRGFRVVMPHLFGRDGAVPSNAEFARTLGKICVSREFTLFATKKASPITTWLLDLAKSEHAKNGGPGVGVIGMCLTGGFALAMMVDPVVVAPVLSQPSLPAGKKGRHELGISDDDLSKVKARTEEGVCVLAYRFSGDKLAPGERFARLHEELGDAFIGVEIDSSEGNPWGYKEAAHSVLTEDLGSTPGSPTLQALESVLSFFDERLHVAD